jgi:diguanylate cyclase (GGDEF)-like protein
LRKPVPPFGPPSAPMLVRISQQLARLSHRRTLMWAFLVVAAAAFADHATNYRLGLSRLSLAAVGLVAWSWGRGPGFAMAALTLSIWTVGERINGPYFFAYMPIWNSVVRAVLFIATVFVLSALRQAVEEERKAARTDFLTGLPNRRAFVEMSGNEIRRARRYNSPFILAYIDIDNFKGINDRFGHNEGDALLRLTAQTIRKGLREVDTVARLGGDEFAVLLPQTNGEHASQVIRKVQQRLAAAMKEMNWDVTYSIGTVTYATPPVSVDEMIKTADNLMYSVKRSGKDQIGFSVFSRKD